MAGEHISKWQEKVKSIHTVDQRQDLHGANDDEKKEVESWLAQFEKELLPLIDSNDKKLSASLHKTNKALLTSTFLVSSHLTLADFVFYASIHPVMAQWSEKDRVIFVNITRWFDHIQNIVARDGAPAKIEINPDCVPFEPRKKKAEEQKQQQQKKDGEKKDGEKKEGEKEGEKKSGKEKKGSGAVPSPAHIPETTDKREETTEKIEKLEAQGVPTKAEETKGSDNKGKGKEKQQQQKPQQEKGAQEKGGKKGGAPAKEPAPKLSETEDVSRLDIRVGLIKTCRRHENADSLYIEEIDVGEEAPRQVVSGLVKFIPLDEMQNRPVLLLCNLKPSNLKGVKSHAMVLAASNEDHTHVELVDPPAGAKIGERVTFTGYSGDPEKALKKETLDIVLPELRSNPEKVATYKGVPFMTSAGVCTVKTIASGGIR